MTGAAKRGRILAGDIGGTKTALALCDASGRIEREESFPSEQHGGLGEIVELFLAAPQDAVVAAAFGVAGPVLGGKARITNLPWVIDEAELSQRLGGVPVSVVNDMETTGRGVLRLDAACLESVHAGEKRLATRALVALGTGVGEAILARSGDHYVVLATEGGHAAFAPRGGEGLELLRFLLARHDHVSIERLLAGDGLGNLFAFVREVGGVEAAAAVLERLGQGDDNALIGEAGVRGSCPASAAALRLFTRVLAQHCTDLALSTMAVGGVYLGGGVVPKVLPILRRDFAAAFGDAGRLSEMVRKIPVWAVLEPKSALLGAIAIAVEKAAAGARST